MGKILNNDNCNMDIQVKNTSRFENEFNLTSE